MLNQEILKQFKPILPLVITFLTGCSIAPKSPIPLLYEKQAHSISANQIYRGVFHVHTRYSHDSSGSITSAIRAARKNRLDFVVITDHNTLKAKDDETTLKHSGMPLLIIGNELSTAYGHLIALGVNDEIQAGFNPQTIIQQIKEQGGFSVLAHPVCKKSYWKNWNVHDFDAMEIYNHSCDFYDANKIGFFMKTIFLSPSLFAKYVVREPRPSLEKWDSLMLERNRLISAIGALDAHVRYRFAGFPLMRYNLSFPVVTMYVTANSPSEKEIIKGLALGNGYFAFESRGHADDFEYYAQSASQTYKMGNTVESEAPLTLVVKVPKNAEIRLIHNGNVVKKAKGTALSIDVKNAGIYRVEVFRHGKIWIVSNPIMVQA